MPAESIVVQGAMVLFLRQQLNAIDEQICRSLESCINAELQGMASAPGLQEFRNALGPLIQRLTPGERVELPWTAAPMLKRAVLTSRLLLATKLEQCKAGVADPRTTDELESRLAPFKAIIRESWFQESQPAPLPQLTDFLTVERAEHYLCNQLMLPPRTYDEKFHILQSPTIFSADMDYHRQKCSMRRLPFVVAFMDIDDFKSFNTAHGESHVDRHLLPRFMAILESHVYGYGHAYRFGGDEYVVLIPNADRPMGEILLRRFQQKLETLAYVGVPKRTTVSIGFCEVAVDCYLTNQELLQRAEWAKNHAKKQGKNCIATYVDEFLETVVILKQTNGTLSVCGGSFLISEDPKGRSDSGDRIGDPE